MAKVTITRADLASALAENLALTKIQASTLIETLLDVIIGQLQTGEMVKIPSFGTFIVHEKNARPGRNPRTGELVEVSARRVVTLRSSAQLKALLESTSI